jgi:hypothetical protein
MVIRCLLVLALAGCYTPAPPNGALLCSMNGECPEGYHCAGDGACWRDGEDPDPLSLPPVLISPRNGASTGAGQVLRSRRPLFQWRANAAATFHEVQFDDSCDSAAFRSCGFPSPEAIQMTSGPTLRPASDLPVSTTAPVGRRYYWRVRACGTRCTPWSEVRYLDVGRLTTDFNGNGDTDLVIGNGNATVNGESNVGAVYIASGTRAGAPGTVTLTAPGGALNDFYGIATMSAGDVDGDGFADLAVTALLGNRAGRVHLYRGGTSWPGSTPSRILENPENQVNASFGLTLASGDINGDGRSDLVVGAELQDAGDLTRGKVFVYPGQVSSEGLRAQPSTVLTHPDNASSNRFGRALAIGDFNGDGYADIAVTAEENGEGSVHIFPGRSGDILVRAAAIRRPGTIAGNEFGHALATGDFNGDGYADLAVGAPRDDGRTGLREVGRVDVYSGGPDGIADGGMPDLTLSTPDVQQGARFGTTLAAASFRANDGDDLAVSAPGHDANAGRVYVFSGAPNLGLTPAPATTLQDPPPTGLFDVFGLLLAVGDRAPADGFFDLFVAARRDSGVVYLHNGGASGVQTGGASTITGDPVMGGFPTLQSLSSAPP